ncbi:substrate-binding domain-containing protein [Cryobacterium tepidiphilum]|uniref:Sugar ABC transporter substrate-binding protein n=1 Tax=Cryobacterium tepidiphilum TaxID=2486026 RepID=A0A3M8LP77_9MICO|nr:substrate-binding domain-containing protein [Cryobacterium tepidiphilum]RNE67347.1 sugar ABC transporter substrate-binding protein [Cryobacterium tepidiphilum]
MKRNLALIAATGAVLIAVSGCSSAGSSDSQAAASANPAVQKAEKALADIVSGKVLSKGPHGETAAPASSADMTEEEIAKVKALNATAAIAMHYGGNDWATAQIAGLKSEFGKLGIKVIATTDANFKPDQQVSQLETLATQKPDLIVSIPTDPVATESAYEALAAAGIKLVFMDNVPNGMTAGEDYVSVVSADNYGNGVVSAYEMAKAIGGKGKIGVIFHQADFFVTKQRYQGFKETINQEFPDIEIVEETGIAGPDFAGQAQVSAGAMLTKHPDLTGIWAVWDVPAEGVMAAARAAGNTNLKIATEDLGTNVAIALAKDQLIVGLGAQRPFDQGVTEARLGALSLIGKDLPAYVAVPALPVDHSNVLDAWKQVYHADPPASIVDSYKK